MADKGTLIIADYSHTSDLSLDELIDSLHLNADFLQNLIDYDIIHPQGKTKAEWVFDMTAIARIRRARRLQQDLEINVAGIATILDLLDELQELREHVALIERHILR